MSKRVVLVTCEDPRLHEITKNGDSFIFYFIRLHDLSPFLVTRAGGIQDIVRPSRTRYDESMIRDIVHVGVEHGSKEIILINHTDCRAYDSLHLDEEQERLQHFNDLLAAKSLLALHTKVLISLYLAEKSIDGTFMPRYLRPGFDYRRI